MSEHTIDRVLTGLILAGLAAASVLAVMAILD